MAKYSGAVCKLCRREGEKLFLKGDRCYSDKCSYDKREYAPGEHKNMRRKLSEYGGQLREKQKLKRSYGLMEKQFKKTYIVAERMSGITGENLLSLLERRLDNAVYMLGFAVSRRLGRLLVTHGHFLVNDKKVDIPSFVLKQGDKITVREKSRKYDVIKTSLESAARRSCPEYFELNADAYEGTLKAIPERDEIMSTVDEKLIVELYSK
ncbi:30S ribosomal protein S4 [Candidatus Acidulodesulfobacterium sp. H_13]|uniref:30S ribosomal protein S4 n=1 Tax=Candidatus Acidulodesulfobacterium sp. H_13 TaxID=3395470 RepID=UPI003AF85C3D